MYLGANLGGHLGRIISDGCQRGVKLVVVTWIGVVVSGGCLQYVTILLLSLLLDVLGRVISVLALLFDIALGHDDIALGIYIAALGLDSVFGADGSVLALSDGGRLRSDLCVGGLLSRDGFGSVVRHCGRAAEGSKVEGSCQVTGRDRQIHSVIVTTNSMISAVKTRLEFEDGLGCCFELGVGLQGDVAMRSLLTSSGCTSLM